MNWLLYVEECYSVDNCDIAENQLSYRNAVCLLIVSFRTIVEEISMYIILRGMKNGKFKFGGRGNLTVTGLHYVEECYSKDYCDIA